jgi:DNA-binding transcriptional regulator YdaS (Cro superfamily)
MSLRKKFRLELKAVLTFCAMSIKEIIQALGGPTFVARRLGVRSQAVSLWSASGRIPADRVPDLEALARELGAPVRAEHMRPDLNWGALRCGA